MTKTTFKTCRYFSCFDFYILAVFQGCDMTKIKDFLKEKNDGIL